MNNSSPREAEPAARYLRQLRQALRPLPEADRADILAEIENHIAERSQAGVSVETVFRGLGDPIHLARGYMENHELARALGRASPWLLVASVLNRATRSVTAFFVGVMALMLYAVALSFALIGVMKPIAPGNVGFWTGPGGPVFGFISSPPPATVERLGLGIVPVALVGAMLCYLAATVIMRFCGRHLLRRAKARSPA